MDKQQGLQPFSTPGARNGSLLPPSSCQPYSIPEGCVADQENARWLISHWTHQSWVPIDGTVQVKIVIGRALVMQGFSWMGDLHKTLEFALKELSIKSEIQVAAAEPAGSYAMEISVSEDDYRKLVSSIFTDELGVYRGYKPASHGSDKPSHLAFYAFQRRIGPHIEQVALAMSHRGEVPAQPRLEGLVNALQNSDTGAPIIPDGPDRLVIARSVLSEERKSAVIARIIQSLTESGLAKIEQRPPEGEGFMAIELDPETKQLGDRTNARHGVILSGNRYYVDSSASDSISGSLPFGPTLENDIQLRLHYLYQYCNGQQVKELHEYEPLNCFIRRDHEDIYIDSHNLASQLDRFSEYTELFAPAHAAFIQVALHLKHKFNLAFRVTEDAEEREDVNYEGLHDEELEFIPEESEPTELEPTEPEPTELEFIDAAGYKVSEDGSYTDGSGDFQISLTQPSNAGIVWEIESFTRDEIEALTDCLGRVLADIQAGGDGMVGLADPKKRSSVL